MRIVKYFVKDGKFKSKSFYRFKREADYESLYTQEYKRKYLLIECGEDSPEPKQTTKTIRIESYE